jgi:hypothetical protein
MSNGYFIGSPKAIPASFPMASLSLPVFQGKSICGNSLNDNDKDSLSVG